MFSRFKMCLAGKKDAKRVVTLFREIDQNLKISDLAKLIEQKQVVIFCKKKKTLGAFSFLKIGLGIFAMIYIRRLVVDKKFRGRGLGGRMLKKLGFFARRKKARGFFLWSLYSAKNFYRKNKLKNWGRIFWWRSD